MHLRSPFPAGMQHRLPRTLIHCCFLTTLSFAEVHADVLPHFWSQRFGDGNGQYVTSVATDAIGNVVVVGSFFGTINFGGGNLTSVGTNDVFVAKFNSAGTHQWSQRFGDVLSQEGRAVKIDAGGNVIIVGHFEGTLNFGGGNLTSVGATDLYIAKFNPSGTHLWSQRFGDLSSQYCNALAVDGSGSIAISGAYLGVVNFGGGNLTSAGDYDIFVAKFNADGTPQWSTRFGDANWQDSSCIAMDGSGNVIIGGHLSGTFSFGGPNVSGTVDVFIAKFNSAGTYQWSRDFGDGAGQYCNSVTTDGSGNVVITGFMDGTMNFGGANHTGTGDVFVAKFNAAGTHQWSQHFGDASAQDGRGLAIDASGNVILAGHFIGTVNFGGDLLTSAGSIDLFLVKFGPSGDHHWSLRFGSASAQQIPSVAVDGYGNIAYAGSFTGTVNFGGSNLASSGLDDAFIAKLGGYTFEPIITSILDIGNDQGRKVKIRFVRSGADDASWPDDPPVRYDAFRRDDLPPGVTAPGREFIAAVDRDVRADGWTQVGTVAAYGDNSYGIDVPTVGDSTVAAGQYHSVFFVRAATATPTVFFDSLPDSGYSLDNLAPGIPSGFVYSSAQLAWNVSSAVDFDYFSVYGGATNSFGSATLIEYTTDHQLNVVGSPYEYYFVTATDFSGNEGGAAVLDATTAVEGAPRSFVLSVSAYPNPFNPQTTIRFTVPSPGRVTVSIFDLRGSHVATLVDEDKDAGAFTRAWDGRDAVGVGVSSGVYFARVAHASGTKSYKMVLLK